MHPLFPKKRAETDTGREEKVSPGQMPIFDRQTITKTSTLIYPAINNSTYSCKKRSANNRLRLRIYIYIYSELLRATQSVLDDNRFTNTTPMSIQQSKDPASSPRSVTQSLSIDQRFFSPNTHTQTRSYIRSRGRPTRRRTRERDGSWINTLATQ